MKRTFRGLLTPAIADVARRQGGVCDEKGRLGLQLTWTWPGGFAKLRPLFFQQDWLASADMIFLIRFCSGRLATRRVRARSRRLATRACKHTPYVWLGLFLAAVLGFSGCKQMGSQDDSLRRDDLSVPARQLRAKENPDRDKKPADDPWMSSEAQNISRDLN